jgi:hypothetical protein
MKKMINKINVRIGNITLSRIMSAFISVIFIAAFKYLISGDFVLDYSDFYKNVGVGVVGFTINETLLFWLTDYFNIRGMNFNLKEILFGYDTIDGGIPSSDFKVKLYLAMESDDGLSGQKIDKGKGVDRTGMHNSDGTPWESNVIPPTNEPEPSFGVWKKVFPVLDPLSIIPKRINPGPGFNVPGGEVPIRDDICRHIDYNTHILKQFKTMDLEVAIEQRNNNILLINNLTQKSAFAQKALSNIPEIPTTEHEFRLKNQIIGDLNFMSTNIAKAEGRVILLNSRIEFIEININNKT